MSKGPTSQSNQFAGFGGVALADILANSVAVMIILFIITLNVKQKQEEERQEKIEDLSILMSRKIARSAVLNALPTSKPARLHNYETAPIDQNLRQSVIPILEFHDNYVRNYYTGERFYKNQLLLKNNVLDIYLKKLTPHQRLATRVDIYSIKLYYIAMSILKEHKINIRHWHFLGYDNYQEKVNGLQGIIDKSHDIEVYQEDEATTDESLALPQLPTGSLLSTTPNSDSLSLSELEALLAQVKNDELTFDQFARLDLDGQSLENIIGLLEQFILGQLQAPSEENQAEENQDQQTQTENQQGSENQTGKKSEELSIDELGRLNELLEKLKTLAENRSKQKGKNSENPPGQFSFSLPNQKQQLLPPSQKNDFALDEKMLFTEVFFVVLLDYLQELQHAFDENKIKNIDLILLFQKVQTAFSNPQYPVNLEHQIIAQRIAKKLFLVEQNFEGIALDQQYSADLPPNSLEIEKNKALESVTIFIDEFQNRFDAIAYDLSNEVFITLFQYPTIHEGEQVALNENDILLVPREQKLHDQFRWRAVLLMSRQKRDFKIGYIYARLTDGSLIVPNDPIQMMVNEHPVVSIVNPKDDDNQSLIFLFYALILALSSYILFRLIKVK